MRGDSFLSDPFGQHVVRLVVRGACSRAVAAMQVATQDSCSDAGAYGWA
jgi:hypothetical protein